MNKTVIFFFITSVLILSSCSVKKRHYMPGYYVNNSQALKTNTSKQSECHLQTITEIVHDYSLESDSCLILLRKGGSDISASIVEISKNEVKYKLCNSSSGEIITINKTSLYGIQYQNGNVERFYKEGKIFKSDCSWLIRKGAPDIRVKIIEVGATEIKYCDCKSKNDSVITIAKSEVDGICYFNGNKQYFRNEEMESKTEIASKNEVVIESRKVQYVTTGKLFLGKEHIDAIENLLAPDEKEKRKTHPKVQVAMVAAILSFIPFIGWLFALIATGCARSSLKEMQEQPQKFKGAKNAVLAYNMAHIALLLGALCLVGGFLFVIVSIFA